MHDLLTGMAWTCIFFFKMAEIATATEITKLRIWRVGEGLTLEEVAGLTGLSVGMISKVERGRAVMAPLTRVVFARRLGVPIQQLFDVEPVEIDEHVVRDLLASVGSPTR